MQQPLLKKNSVNLNFEVYAEKPEFPVLKLKQVHSNKIVDVKTIKSSDKDIEADGIIFENNDQNILAIVTADCLPIYLRGENLGVFLHAGWKGLNSGILEDERIKKLRPSYAFIGPHIKECCFEVTDEFRDHFSDESHFTKRDSKLYFNLEKEARSRLKKLNSNMIIEIAQYCTCCQEDFHSYRANKTIARNWNIIHNIV